MSVYTLWIWSSTGQVMASIPLTRKVTSLAAAGECDACLPELGQTTLFLKANAGAFELVTQQQGTPPGKPQLLSPGQPRTVGDWQFAVLMSVEQVVPTAASETPASGMSDYPNALMVWLRQPMAGRPELIKHLQTFLSLVVTRSQALGGMIVLAEDTGFQLIAHQGLAATEAETLWRKMPDDLTEAILREEARLILPAGLRDRGSSKSTVFVKDTRAVVGFPVVAEGCVVAILFLTFRNILAELTSDIEQTMRLAADILGVVIQRALLREDITHLKHLSVGPLNSLPDEPLLIGGSPAILEVYRVVTRLANFDVPVLIEGETGTGKELVARELHRLGPRRDKAFVAINAAALPDTLIESELFGYRRGAFSCALNDKTGLIESAHGGTLFIDEIGELPLGVQSKLLRVLQERSITRLGDTQPRPVDFRLIAATHRDSDSMVREKTFREDLFYRIAATRLTIPPLRDRPDDIMLLASFFKQRFARRHGLSEKEWTVGARVALEGHPWKGNVRELENTVARACVMSEGLVIRRQDLGPEFGPSPDNEPDEAAAGGTLEDARNRWMREYLTSQLRLHQGNRGTTARALGIGLRTLFRYLEQLGIKDEQS